MAKRVFLYVAGGDYSALSFEENYSEQEVYEKMVIAGETFKALDHDDYYIEVYIKEFEDIDPKFIDFIRDNFIDYDMAKDYNFYEVTPFEEEDNAEL